MENLRVLIFKSLFLGLAPLREARQGISCSISLSLIIIDSEVVSRELLGPIDLTRTQTLCIRELMEVVVASEDEDLVFAAFQVVAPSLKGLNNNQELLMVGFVSSLSRNHLSKQMATGCHWPISDLG